MKLRNISIAILSTCALLLTSCKDEQKTEVTPTQTQEETSNTAGTTAELNPAHGQPGHRCDIPVGTPLDQAAASNTQQQQVTPSNVSPVRMNSSTATPTKNPPHGQPGHDCSVPVGADLTQS